jgi:hypothetical protein
MISPADLIIYARNLYTPTAKEIVLRSGISRAYYGAYHYCLDVANRWCDEVPPEEMKKAATPLGMHARLYVRMEKYCREAKVSDSIRFMAQRAKSLHNERVTADYALDVDVGAKQITTALYIAGEIQSEYNKLVS